MRYQFYKYHGLGNDFLLFDLRKSPEHARELAQKAIDLCDRRFGVGGDGIFLILADERADARVEIYNADGSRPEMCGNGIRCAARFLYEHDSQPKTAYQIQTDAGQKECRIILDESSIPSSVVVEMGAPELSVEKIPFVHHEPRAIEAPLDSFLLTAVSMGNPHAVIFNGFTESPIEAARRYGPKLEVHPRFPKKTNVEFARVIDGGLEVAIWERGCGITLACGTGACATLVAAVLTGRQTTGVEVPVRVPGGSLFITVLPGFTNVLMRGPAQPTFFGEVELSSVSSLSDHLLLSGEALR
jgi:diaminopimelate epimerase